jgi:hypothetical protein
MPHWRRQPDSVPIALHCSALTAPRRAGCLLTPLHWLGALHFGLETWLRFRRGTAPPGLLRLLRLPAENATRNTGARPPADQAAGGGQSP